tara:strand:- start:1466 stop:1690 length:225 start_codon:yes stop_codon:yes gene_type:complete
MVTNASCPAQMSGVIEIPLMAAIPGCYLYSMSFRPAGVTRNNRKLSQFSAILFDSKRGSDPEAEMLQNLIWEKT